MKNTFIDIGNDVDTLERCIICNEISSNTDKRFARCLGLVLPYDVKFCSKCELRWLSPRPTLQAYSRLYTYENYFGGSCSVEDYSSIAQERRFTFRKRIQNLERSIGGNKPLKILDIGAATGEFVYEGIERGHEAVGVELSAEARRIAKEKYGIELIEGSMETLKAERYYDVIHMSHVLEHLMDPMQALDISFSLLGPSGLLVIEVPQQFYNDLDRLKRLLHIAAKPEFNAYSLHHTFFFTPKSLSWLLQKKKFFIRSIRTANKNRTPLYPIRAKNLFLRYYLGLSDFLHQGGNIIEVYAGKYRAKNIIKRTTTF